MAATPKPRRRALKRANIQLKRKHRRIFRRGPEGSPTSKRQLYKWARKVRRQDRDSHCRCIKTARWLAYPRITRDVIKLTMGALDIFTLSKGF